MQSKTSLGIDFGSTGYCAAVVFDGQIITLPTGRWSTLSHDWIAFSQTATSDGVGHIQFPSIKHCIEQKSPIITMRGSNLAYNLVINILQEIQAIAQSYLDGAEIDQTIMAVPATYPESRRSLLIDAAKQVGLPEPGLINDAIAIAGNFSLQHLKDATLLIYNAGYTQCEIAIVRQSHRNFRALAYGSIDRPSGRILDDSILTGCLRALQERGFSLQGVQPQLWLQLQQQAQQFKEKLNSLGDVHFPIPDATGNKYYYISFSKLKFDALIEQLMRDNVKEIDSTLQSAKLKLNDISHVIVTGGTTRLTAVQNSLQTHFANHFLHTMTDDAIARGAAAFAADLFKSQDSDLDLLKIKGTANMTTNIGVDFLSPETVKLTIPVFLDLNSSEGQTTISAIRTTPSKRQIASKFDLSQLWRYVHRLKPAAAQEFIENLQYEAEQQMKQITPTKPRQNWRIQKAHELLAQGKYDEAVQASHLALGSNPDNYQVLVDMIDIHRKAAESAQTIEGYDDAIQWLLCAQSHDQSDLKTLDIIADRHLLHAHQLSEQKDFAGALKAIKACLAVKSGHIKALELRKDLTKKLRSNNNS